MADNTSILSLSPEIVAMIAEYLEGDKDPGNSCRIFDKGADECD